MPTEKVSIHWHSYKDLMWQRQRDGDTGAVGQTCGSSGRGRHCTCWLSSSEWRQIRNASSCNFKVKMCGNPCARRHSRKLASLLPWPHSHLFKHVLKSSHVPLCRWRGYFITYDFVSNTHSSLAGNSNYSSQVLRINMYQLQTSSLTPPVMGSHVTLQSIGTVITHILTTWLADLSDSCARLLASEDVDHVCSAPYDLPRACHIRWHMAMVVSVEGGRKCLCTEASFE